MLEMFEYSFVQRALAASLLVGTSCSIIGVYVVLRGLAFIGAGIAHAAFGGVALGFLLGLNPLLTAVVFCLGVSGAIHATHVTGRIKLDASIGIFYSLTMALGVLFIGLMKTYDARLYGYLFGNILSVSSNDIYLIGGLTLAVIATVVLLFKEFELVSFDAEMAEALGLRAKTISFVMLTLVSLTIVLSLEAVGVMLVFALIVTPAAAANQLTYSYRAMFFISAFFGNLSCFAGLVLSYYFDIPSGATIVLTSTTLFFACMAVSPKRRKKAA